MSKDELPETNYDVDTAVEGESKAQRFSRVVNPRLKRAVERLRMIRQMFEGANANNYEFTEAQQVRMINALHAEVEDISALMTKRLKKTGDTFDVEI